MVEKILGKQQAEDIRMSAMLACMMTEKQASEALDCLEKLAATKEPSAWGIAKDILGAIWGNAKSGLGHVADIVKETPSALGWVGAIGAGAGALGAGAYNVFADRMSREDPEAKFNADVEAMYANKRRELSDAKWMAKVREMRDDLKRNHKKMTSKEYSQKYQELLDALDERS